MFQESFIIEAASIENEKQSKYCLQFMVLERVYVDL